MTKYLLAGLFAVVLMAVVACGGDDDAPGFANQSTPQSQSSAEDLLREIAASLAGGPGAIYVGDLSQLVGPAPREDLGGLDGAVPLDSLQRHIWAYDHPYYRGLLVKANFTNPTKLVSQDERFLIQHLCLSETFQTCKLIESYWAPNLLERTNGQMKLEVTDFASLGLPATDTLSLVNEGTLGMTVIFSLLVARELPQMLVTPAAGYPSHEVAYKLQTSVLSRK